MDKEAPAKILQFENVDVDADRILDDLGQNGGNDFEYGGFNP
eukprot:CAMPEP_0114582238 /NCGR_PEP_ID=MMETSP0125-20121206/6264_1 /TAXON_ID=485358 ORGANISM="Aristerostoma sp., Strain ATCC 50986" /NCGR_SAMPLE_ID=MMETSP0125 /ASSEMBLY_ACC=CAM_ASM_000245 /LENGTH=41 /DNA_ID= /DNA_START= /DNA_END= /DNA_ORIENTATION=